jgi:hypothetical protein
MFAERTVMADGGPDFFECSDLICAHFFSLISVKHGVMGHGFAQIETDNNTG